MTNTNPRNYERLPSNHSLSRLSSFWEGKTVLVTGGAGFIGSHLVESLVTMGASVRIADSFTNGSAENLKDVSESIHVVSCDLTNSSNCIEACQGVDVVMNLAAKVAGVGYNTNHSSEMFLSNVRIGMNMLEAARQTKVEKFLCVSSACVYSREAPVPTNEKDGFLLDPEPSNLGYGWAKRVLEVQSKLYAEQYAMKIAIVRPFNTYGPRDHFDSKFGHVIPSLLLRVTYGENPLVVWGDGKQTRSFVFVSDVVRGMLMSIEKYATADPINIGSDEEISIGDLAHLVVDLVGSRTKITFDPSKPKGQPRRCPDVTKAKTEIGFEAKTKLYDGLRTTISWLREGGHARGIHPIETSAFKA